MTISYIWKEFTLIIDKIFIWAQKSRGRWLWPQYGFAKVELLEKDEKNKPIQLEKGFKFVHYSLKMGWRECWGMGVVS